MRKVVILVVCALLSGSAFAGGRPDKNWKDWFGHFSAGYTFIQSDASEVLDDDWYFSGGATYWPETFPIGINLDLSYANYDVSSKAIDAINDELLPGGQVTGGDVDVWGLTVNALWSPMKEGRTGFYIVGGLGGYYVDARLTDTGVVYYPPGCYWYWCYPGGVGQGTFETASDTTTEFGLNAGLGVTFEVGTGSQIFLEAKYHWIDTDRETTSLLPFTVGYRW